MGSLAVLLGFDAADRLGGGPADGAGVVVAEVDGDDLGGDVDGDDARAWMRPRAIFCPATMMTPVLLATRWAVTGSADGRGGGPAGRAPRSWRAWSQVSGLGRVRSSSRVADRRTSACSARSGWRPACPPRISAARTVAAGQVDRAVLGHDPVDLDRGAGLGGRQRRRPGGPGSGGGQGGQVRRRTGGSGRS